MITQIIIFIIFVIVICIIISSIGYSDKNINMNRNKDTIVKPLNIGNVKTEIINNCTVIGISNVTNNSAYLLEGKFSNSCISIYKNNEHIHSRLINGDRSFVLTSNLILTNNVFRLSKFKSELLPLENDSNYTISVNNINDINVKDYTINYNINSVPINYTYSKNIAINEYDIIKSISNEYPNIERCIFKNVEKENKWVFKNEGSYILIILKNLYNIDLTINEQEKKLRKMEYDPVYEIIAVQNPNIVAFNLDYKSRIKGINKEYIEFITSPNHLMSKFLYGSKAKEIDYISQINDKILIFKVKEV